jgi:hypothetical protein
MKTNCWLNQNRFLSHLSTSFCALAIVGASLTLPSADADPPPTADGTFFPCFNILSFEQAGPNTIITFHVTARVEGTFTGCLEGTERDVIHPDGYITFQGSAIFTSSVGTGTLQYTYTGEGNANPRETVHGLLPGEESAHFVAGQGSDDLAGVNVWGTFHGFLAGSGVGCSGEGCFRAGQGTYTGQYLFAP